MAKLHIETGDNNEILRRISFPIQSNEIRQYRLVAHEMIKYIKNPDNGGVGLAAPQIGINKRLIVVSLMNTYDDEQYRTLAMINPVIVDHSSDTCRDVEGCLSVPGETGEVNRWKTIRVEFFDVDGKKQALFLENLAARIVQHEIDHLDGILFTDKIEKLPEILFQNSFGSK